MTECHVSSSSEAPRDATQTRTSVCHPERAERDEGSFDCAAPGLAVASFFLTIFFLKAVATALTVGSGGSGGVFGPALVCGASLGAATGIVMQHLLPASVGIHPAAFALVGMAGFISAAIRTPITAIVMVAEISGNHELLLPTMWVCGISFWLTRGWTLYRSQLNCRRA